LRTTIMARKQSRISNRMSFTLLMLVGLIFLFAPQNLTNKFQFAFARIFRWPLSISRNLSLFVPTRQPASRPVSKREFDKLQNHLANVREELLQERKKVEKLSGLRNRFPWEGANFVLTDVITSYVDELQSELIINKGQDDGLSKGLFVLGDNSIIGIISSADSRTARVRLFTDPQSNIPVTIPGADVSRVMQGAGNCSATVRMIKKKVKTGDNIFAAKKPGFLDTPMVIGKVVQCKMNNESPLLWDIMVKPVCDIEKLNDVAVIIMNPQGSN